ncbi:MAG: hypothetical protein WD939_06050 [Dehalococcoidia bacterium]
MKKAAVVLGAGASFDVHNDTVPVLNPDLRPPVARQLFDARFWHYRRPYRGAEVLGAELGRLARDDSAFDLEARLTQYATSSDERTRRHFKDVPPYLRDVLMHASNEYVPSPTNYINLVRRLLQDGTHEITFVVLNYDTLLERALSRYDRSLTFRNLDEYVTPGRQARVIKIHGSTNWAVSIPGTGRGENQNIGWERALDQFEPSSAPSDQTLVDERDDTSHGWRHPDNGRFLYPRLTAPLREKTFSCPEEHTWYLADFLSACHKFMIIGTSGLDDDLLDVMEEAVTAPCMVQYVNLDEGVVHANQRFESKIRAFRERGPTAPEPQQFRGGLTNYLDTDALERLINAD